MADHAPSQEDVSGAVQPNVPAWLTFLWSKGERVHRNGDAYDVLTESGGLLAIFTTEEAYRLALIVGYVPTQGEPQCQESPVSDLLPSPMSETDAAGTHPRRGGE